MNGISNNEKANLLMEHSSFRELLSDEEHRELMSSIIGLKAQRLFAPAEISMGITPVPGYALYLIRKKYFPEYPV